MNHSRGAEPQYDKERLERELAGLSEEEAIKVLDAQIECLFDMRRTLSGRSGLGHTPEYRQARYHASYQRERREQHPDYLIYHRDTMRRYRLQRKREREIDEIM